MATAIKKNGSIESKMGRPQRGVLSSFPKKLVKQIKKLRLLNEGWGAISILVELESEYKYSPLDLPSVDTINRYLKQEGFMKKYEPSSPLPKPFDTTVVEAHDLWEMDAQGAISVEGIGYHSIINMKDSHSKKHCISFPIAVKNSSSQPTTRHYKWAFRLAFLESGLPKAVQVDNDSVFIENSSKSPFPSRLHLWLIALGIELSFINVPPPLKQAMVERSHQTIERQSVRGKTYQCWQQLFKHITKRRKRLNEHFPNRSLGKKAPLQVFPEAKHSGKKYSIRKEKRLIDLNRIYHFLSKGKWFRKVSSGKMISLGSIRYYLKNSTPKNQVQITFSMLDKLLIFRDVNEQIIAQIPLKGISVVELMGNTTDELIDLKRKISKEKNFSI